MIAGINFGSFVCFLYILLVHWACVKIALLWVLMESFEFVFLSLVLLDLLAAWIYSLTIYFSQLVAKRWLLSLIILNFKLCICVCGSSKWIFPFYETEAIKRAVGIKFQLHAGITLQYNDKWSYSMKGD